MGGGAFVERTAAGPHEDRQLRGWQHPVSPDTVVVKIGVHDAAVLVVIRRIVLIPETVINSQFRSDFPYVFVVERPGSRPELDARQCTGPVEGTHLPDQEIRE